MTIQRQGRIVAICGGVGGAKLALGLQDQLKERLTVAVNMADDFSHLGLEISPDLDTVLYTLGNLSDQERGWGRSGETWNFMSALAMVGGETWFQLGDQDLATHVERTRRLREGETITQIAQDFARRFNVTANVLPATNDKIRTMVETEQGEIPFQRYFVEQRCAPAVRAIRFAGMEKATPSSDIEHAFESDGLDLIIICPSNPYLSVDPVIKIPGFQNLIKKARAPVVAISPLIGGQSIKGPTKKVMEELKIPVTTASIFYHYRHLIDGLVVDTADSEAAKALGAQICATPTLMHDRRSKIELAKSVIDFGQRLRSVLS
jgi:LPPG:FO 2-phospho-L-lactate transferase